MPLIRRDPAAPSPSGEPRDDGLEANVAALRSPDAARRWSAARALGAHPAAAAALGDALLSEQVPSVREVLVTALLRMGTQASVTALLPCLRSEDAGLRAGAIEALQALPAAVRP